MTPSEASPRVTTSLSRRLMLKRTWQLHAMLIPAVALVFVFNYVPMAGVVMAFQDFKPWLGFFNSPWIGWDNFRQMFERPDSVQVIWNTLVLSFWKLSLGLVVPYTFAILLNEFAYVPAKRTVQTLVYLPHFLSWVILGGIFIDILSPNGGLLNRFIEYLGFKPVFFLGSNAWFRTTVVVTHVWKEFGFSAIIFLAALAGINPSLYESAEIDGANRFQQTMHITMPGLLPITIVVGVLGLGNIMNAGFDQIFNLYNPLVYETGDIIDTFVYRVALLNGNMSFGTAVGLFKSAIGFVLITSAYRLAYVYANYRIF